MAYPSKTSPQKIVAAAITLIERDGLDALTVARLAEYLGIKAPSLYKRFSGISAILQEVERSLLLKLAKTINEAVRDESAASLLSACHAHREFAKRHINLYPMLFSRSYLDETEATEMRFRTAAPILKILSRHDASLALQKARTITAFLHGFVSIELTNGFQMGGDVDIAFNYGAKTLVDSLLRE